MREENVIKRCQSGDESAFEELISFYYPHVSGFLSNMACRRDMIEDIVQETFIKMIRGIDRFDLRGNAKFSTYLFTIARNCYIERSAGISKSTSILMHWRTCWQPRNQRKSLSCTGWNLRIWKQSLEGFLPFSRRRYGLNILRGFP